MDVDNEEQEANFKVGQTVLCYHGMLIYEAKILKENKSFLGKGETGDGSPHYFVHYKGWKDTWDEWVPESRIMRITETTQKLQKQLFEQVQSKQKKQESKKRDAADSGTDRGKKRPRDLAEADEDYKNKPEVKIPIPDNLKLQLVDDWERITKNRQVVPLPRSPTVSEVLEQYREHRVNSKPAAGSSNGAARDARSDDVLNEVLDGLKLYFDRALGNVLLYRFERAQYQDLLNKHQGKEMSDLYGAEHLLRLFVQMPVYIAHTNMDTEATNILRQYLEDILKWMAKNQKTLFSAEYDNVTGDYEMRG